MTYIHDGMELPVENWNEAVHSFDDLAGVIISTHDAALTSAVKAINRMQTMRNWLIGYYIVEFEQHGKDRAEYGTGLLKKLEARVNRKGLTETLFKWARKFYRLYPQIHTVEFEKKVSIYSHLWWDLKKYVRNQFPE